MSVPGLDAARCRARNFRAAARGFSTTGPIRFYRSPPPPLQEATLVGARGTLPSNDAQALHRINALVGREDRPLQAEQVHLVYPEAANTNYIADRYLFMDKSTLKNVGAE